MDWLKAASFVALGMITAMRNGLAGAAVAAGAEVAAGADVAAGAEVAGADVAVAAGPQAVASSAINNKPTNSMLLCFTFILLKKNLLTCKLLSWLAQ